MVRISRGETVADGLAIEAKAHPLGIVFDPKTREITEAGARGSAVKGGLAGVALAATATGAADVLDHRARSAVRWAWMPRGSLTRGPAPR